MGHKNTKIALGCALGLCLSGITSADPVTHTRTWSDIDWASAGISGIGGGSGTITLAGVTGTVGQAFLFWHGIDTAGDGVYDNANITFNGNAISGTSIGDASTNCWGTGSSTAFRADVTAYVSGNGDYDLAGLSAPAGNNANGASLVVSFDDGNTANNHDLVFFEGNDSDVPQGYPGDPNGWFATLSPINYQGGSAGIEFHVADGQNFSDGTVTISTPNGNLVIADTANLWDGNSLPSAGTSRTGNGNLYDIHDFDITSAFGAVMGPVELTVDGQNSTSDCHSLVLALVELETGSAPPPPGEPPPPAPSEPPIPVPAMGPVSLALLSGLILLVGVAVRRRRKLH